MIQCFDYCFGANSVFNLCNLLNYKSTNFKHMIMIKIYSTWPRTVNYQSISKISEKEILENLCKNESNKNNS